MDPNSTNRPLWGNSRAPRTAPPETEADKNAVEIASLTCGVVVEYAPWVYFGHHQEDLARCEEDGTVFIEIKLARDEAIALLKNLRKIRGEE